MPRLLGFWVKFCFAPQAWQNFAPSTNSARHFLHFISLDFLSWLCYHKRVDSLICAIGLVYINRFRVPAGGGFSFFFSFFVRILRMLEDIIDKKEKRRKNSEKANHGTAGKAGRKGTSTCVHRDPGTDPGEMRGLRPSHFFCFHPAFCRCFPVLPSRIH